MIIDPVLLLAQIAWETMVKNVRMLSDWTYCITVSPENLNDVGAGTKEVGFYFIDNNGEQYSVTAINVGGVSTDIIVNDDFKCGSGPVTDRTGIVYEAVGDSRYLAQVMYSRLDSTAQDKGRAIDLAVLWDAIKRNFTELLDCPPSLVDQALKSLRVKADELGIEFYNEDRFLPLIAGDEYPLLNPLTVPSIKMPVGAGVNKVWQCTNETTGAGQWGSVSTDQHFVSMWNASTNIPVLADGVGTNGYYHKVEVGGTVDLGHGLMTFAVGDKALYNGTIWQLDPKLEVDGFPLTKTDDTNIGITLGGSPSTSLLNAVSIAINWIGTLADSRIASAAIWNAKQPAGNYILDGDGRLTNARVASDVYSWAKQSNKPSYNYSEIDSTPSLNYLPLPAGASYPLTGPLYINTATGANFQDAIIFNKLGGYGSAAIQQYYNTVSDYGLWIGINGNNKLKINQLGDVFSIGSITSPLNILLASNNNANDYNYLIFNNTANGYADWNIHKKNSNDIAIGYGTNNGVDYTDALTLSYGGIVTFSNIIYALGGNSTEWNAKVSFPGFGTTHALAAYGDHTHTEMVTGTPWTLEGYIKSFTEIDPVFTAWNKSTGISITKSQISDFPTIPTQYTHPTNHAPSIISQDVNNRFVTDTEKAYWNAKQPAGAYLLSITSGDVTTALGYTPLPTRTFGSAANNNTGDFVAARTFGSAANNATTDFAAASHGHAYLWNLSVQALSGTSPSWNGTNGINASIALSGNTTVALSNLIAGMSGNLTVVNPSALYTLTFSGYTNKISSAVYLAANQVKVSGSSKIDVFSWYFDGTYLFINGTDSYN